MLYLNYDSSSGSCLFIRDGRSMIFSPDSLSRFKKVFGIGDSDWFSPVECGFSFEGNGLCHVFKLGDEPFRFRGRWKMRNWSRMASGRLYKASQLWGIAEDRFSELRGLFSKLGKEPYMYLWNIGLVLFDVQGVRVKRID